MSGLLRLAASGVQIGVALPWSVRNASGMLLLARGFVIEEEQQLRQLLERGAYVDAVEAHYVAQSEAAKLVAAVPRALGPFEEWSSIYRRLETPLKNAGTQSQFLPVIDALARDIVTLIERDVDVSIYTFVRQENIQFFNYGFTHSVHTAIACVLMARRLGWPAARIVTLAQAALTMNVAIVGVQGRIATQDVPLRECQKTAIREHPGKSVTMLQQSGVTNPSWLAAVAQHHEHPDGTGYPDGRTEIDPLALMLHFADTFTAKISPRASRPGVSIQQAARELFQEERGGAMSSALIKELGIYPPGDFVQLKSGEFAVVMRRSANARTPIAASVTDKAGLPVPRTTQRDTADPAFAIVASVTDRKRLAMLTRIPPQRLYGLSV